MATHEEAASEVVLLSHLKAKQNKKEYIGSKPGCLQEQRKGLTTTYHNSRVTDYFTDPAS